MGKKNKQVLPTDRGDKRVIRELERKLGELEKRLVETNLRMLLNENGASRDSSESNEASNAELTPTPTGDLSESKNALSNEASNVELTPTPTVDLSESKNASSNEVSNVELTPILLDPYVSSPVAVRRANRKLIGEVICSVGLFCAAAGIILPPLLSWLAIGIGAVATVITAPWWMPASVIIATIGFLIFRSK